MGTIAQAGAFQLEDVIKIQRERSRLQDYVALGRIVEINLELQLPAGRKISDRDRLLLPKIDYRNDGPMVARSKDSIDCLLPFGAKKFPDVPDPLWTPAVPTKKQLADKDWRPQTAPLVKQDMFDRAAGRFGDTAWVYFQRVIEVWYRPFAGPADYRVVRFHPFLDTQAALVINAETCEAFFYGGRPEFVGCR